MVIVFLCLNFIFESIAFLVIPFGNSSAPSDTVDLATVEVFTPSLEKYTYGQTVKSISKEELIDFQGQPLAEYLQQRTGLFLRQYGPGMLASLTMRGTSAGHNAVFWNGLPINSPSLGQADFSILPIGGFDEATVHFGGGGALYGTDAIGGAIHLNNKLRFNQGHRVNLNLIHGSFGRWSKQVGYSFSTKRFSTKTSVYSNQAENNFPFRNLAKPGTPTERQTNSQVEQVGFNQDLAFNITEKDQLSTSLWYNQTDRQIQPIMGSEIGDIQSDENLRWVLDYFRFGENKIWNIKSGIVRDELVFNINSNNQTTQYLLSGDLDWQISDKISSKSGLRYTYIVGNLSTYTAEESRIELYQATNFKPLDNLMFSVNLRQLVYESELAPFTPSLGGEWSFYQSKNHQISLTSNISRSFKVPTLNDRFWVPGGNPSILSEKSISGEIGLVQASTLGKMKFDQRVTFYQMKVENWIIWLPRGSFWSPENIRDVKNTGLEYFINMEYSFGSWTGKLSGNYAWNRAINQTNISESDRSKGKQLPYTPKHNYQVLGSVERNGFGFFINQQAVGERFVATDNALVLASYRLWDSGVNYSWKIASLIEGRVSFQVNNAFDNDYQVMRLRAMPGRNYQLNFAVIL